MRKKTVEFETSEDDVSIINLEGVPSAIVNNRVHPKNINAQDIISPHYPPYC